MPRATSAAKLGPDRIAGTAAGAHSAITSVMNFSVPRSIPLAQTIIGVRGAISGASNFVTARTACAGTTTRIAGACAASAGIGGDRNAVIDAYAGQELAFAFFGKLREREQASGSQSVTSRPARAQVSASAVPQAPAPMTAMWLNAMSL